MNKNKTFALGLGLLSCTLAGSAVAQAFPSRPVAIVVPFAAGGPTDTMARLMAQQFSTVLKNPVVVENYPGAGGTVGSARVARATPDGHTILLFHIGMSTAPALYKTLPFDPLKDFEYIGQVADVPMMLLTRSTLKLNGLKELTPYLQANREKVTVANAGLGAASHLCGLLFMSSVGIEMTTVAYKGTAPAMSDLLGGQVDVLCDQTSNTVAQVKAGKVNVIGVTTATRLKAMPDIPTLAEQGLKGFSLAVWHGLYAPRGTPKAALDTLNKALNATIADPGFNAKIGEFGAESVSADRATLAGLRNHLAAEIAKWGPIIRKAGVFAN